MLKSLWLVLNITILSSFHFAWAAQTNAIRCPDYKMSSAKSDDKKLEAFMKTSWDDYMKDRPEWGYDLGYKELGDLWSDDSFDGIKARKDKADCLKTAINQIKRSKLSEANKVSYDILAQEIEMSIQSKKFPAEYLVFNQLGAVHSDIADTLLNMPQGNAEEVAHILARLKTAKQKVAQHKLLLQEGLKQSVTVPQVVLKKVSAQFDDILKENPKDSILFKPFSELKALDEAKRAQVQEQALKTIKDELYPAIQDFKTFIVSTYIPQARQSISIQDLPYGKEWYEWQIRHQTTTNMTAEEVHQLGLKEVERILKEMEAVKTKVGFKKDLKAFNQFLLTDPQFYYEKSEDLMRGYRDIAKQIDGVLPQFFKTLPRLSYGVHEMPAFKAPASPSAYYMPGSPSLGRAGFFEANTYDLKARPKWGMEALTLHESVPGHHLQIAIAQELGDLPEFRKNDGYTAFVEGWGLYAETVGEEMGFYKDPYSKYGKLTFEMWRAVRLVVDTGMHAKGWSREKALKFFMDHLAKSQLESEVEIDRYIVWPGQALAYKIGELKLLEIRAKAKAELKEKFDIREFHDAILSGGAMPLTLLETRMANWVSAQKTKSAKKLM
jgi:uncharacterized protein (DUF885 family)